MEIVFRCPRGKFRTKPDENGEGKYVEFRARIQLTLSEIELLREVIEPTVFDKWGDEAHYAGSDDPVRNQVYLIAQRAVHDYLMKAGSLTLEERRQLLCWNRWLDGDYYNTSELDDFEEPEYVDPVMDLLKAVYTVRSESTRIPFRSEQFEEAVRQFRNRLILLGDMGLEELSDEIRYAYRLKASRNMDAKEYYEKHPSDWAKKRLTELEAGEPLPEFPKRTS